MVVEHIWLMCVCVSQWSVWDESGWCIYVLEGGCIWVGLCETEREYKRKYACIWIGFVCEQVSLDNVQVSVCANILGWEFVSVSIRVGCG